MVFDVIEFMEIVSSCFKRKIIPVFPADAVKLFHCGRLWISRVSPKLFLLLFFVTDRQI